MIAFRRWLPAAPLLLLTACAQETPNTMVGTLERDRIELTAEVSEPILEIAADDGVRVGAGERVVLLDPERQQARVAEAQGELARTLARLDELRRGPREEAIDQARARLAASQTRLQNATRAADRAVDLHQRGLGSEADRDDRLAERDARRAEVTADREALAELLNGTTVEELQQAAAATVVARARVRQAEIAASRTDLRAPGNATVDRVLYEVGEQPPAGATVAVLIADTDPYARIYVPEPLRTQVQPGTQVRVLVDGAPSEYPGTVRWVSADASFTPYFALTEHDRSRLAYLAEVDVPGAADLPSGVPLEVRLDGVTHE